ncbi:MAG TPA: tail fiber domain-containing protein [Pyrinomonadaceae bacterium]|nr:tail fiber domain-containing protein [Pyrinomonadaceae bacterium]
MSDSKGERWPDGQYTYELRLSPVLSQAARDILKVNRGKDDDPEEVRAARKRLTPTLVESGSFAILNGAAVVAGSMEEPGRRPSVKATERSAEPGTSVSVTKAEQHHPLRVMRPDDVIPDDLIVQGSACVGLDCVNGEVFGFDTIRVKENNTRIQFDDTSAAGFPLNNWQIRANSSGAGGASFLGFVDQGDAGNSETGTIVFEVDAGAPANALKVSSGGKVGLRTATPVLDVHANTSDTPAMRLEQNNSGGFTAQTWDVAGNEANFFVRDVTGGSRLPFRIRPGAPTSSVDIAASGNVGIGFASPELRLDARVANTTTDFTNNVTYAAGIGNLSGKRITIGYDETGQDIGVIQSVQTGVGFKNLALNPNSGNVGIGTTAPTDTLSVNGTASKTGGGAWAVFSDERLKNIKGDFTSGLQAIMKLQPLRYEYKQNNPLGLRMIGEQIGFGAHAVQQVIPEAVTEDASGYLKINNDPILWTMLNAIKEQQKQIEQLQGEVKRLRATSRRHR